MSVITISREFGSEGSYIAEKAARTLGYHLADKQTMEDVLTQYGFVEFDKEYDATRGFWARFDARTIEMITMLNRVIQAVARHGNVVILGRGGFAILSGFADVLNVLIQAPLPVRQARVMTRQKLAEPEKAEAIIKEADRVRTTFIGSYYGTHWNAANAFDLVIDTGKVPPDLAVTWLADTIKAMPAQPAGEARLTRTLEVDPILISVVSNVLKCQEAHQ
jgi:cytidylate kinase